MNETWKRNRGSPEKVMVLIGFGGSNDLETIVEFVEFL